MIFNNRSLAILVVPLIVEQLMAVFVGLADTVMISSTGEAAVSAISVVDSLLFLFIGLFGSFATGGAVVTGQYLGRGDFGDAKKSAMQLLWFSGIFGVIIAVTLGVAQQPLIEAMFGQLDSVVFDHSMTYMNVVNVSIPFLAVYSAAAAIFRTMGNSKVTMVVAIAMNVINVIGNAVLIYGFSFGVLGAAIPTLVSRIFACVALVVLLYRSPTRLSIRGNLKFRLDVSMLRKILGIGVPNGIESSSFQLGKLLLVSVISTLGTTAITANAVTNSIAMINIVPGMAFSMATLTIVSRCVGAGDYEQARYYNIKLIRYCYLTTTVLSGIVMLFANPILSLYNLTEQTHEIAFHLTMVHCIGSIAMWPLSFQLPNTLRAAGDARFTMVVSMFSMWVVRLLGGYLLAIPLGLGVAGVWYAMMLDWVVRSICMVTRYNGTKWMKKKVI